MKTLKWFLFFSLAISIAITSCSKNDDDDPGNGPVDNPADTVAIDQLIVYYKFNGDVTDKNGHTTTEDGVVYTTDRFGNAESAYKGSADAYAKVSQVDDFFLGSITMSMWLRAQPLGGGTNFIVSFLDPDIDWNAGYGLWQEGSSRGDTLRYKAFTKHAGELFVWTDTEWGDAREVLFPSSKWFHLVYTYDAGSSERSMYLNGNMVMQDTALFEDNLLGAIVVPATATDFYIGKNPNTAHEWLGNYEGDLDDLRIYDIALTEDQVGWLYEGENEAESE
ncbi:hypothetical protein ES705_08562 [subsurface metagenome]